MRLTAKAVVLSLLLTGLAFLPTGESTAAEDPCSACYTSYNLCIAGPFPRCERMLEICVNYYCN